LNDGSYGPVGFDHVCGEKAVLYGSEDVNLKSGSPDVSDLAQNSGVDVGVVVAGLVCCAPSDSDGSDAHSEVHLVEPSGVALFVRNVNGQSAVVRQSFEKNVDLGFAETLVEKVAGEGFVRQNEWTVYPLQSGHCNHVI